MFVGFAVGYLRLELNFCFNTADSPPPSSPPLPLPLGNCPTFFCFLFRYISNPVSAQIPVMPFVEEAQLSTHKAPDFNIVANTKMPRR